MDESTIIPEAETGEEARDSEDSVPAFADYDEDRRIRHYGIIFDELFLPLDTMEELERDSQAVVVAADSAQERLEGLRDGRDGLILVDDQRLEQPDVDGNLNQTVSVDIEEQQLQDGLRALLERPSFFTHDTDFEAAQVRHPGYDEFFETLEDDPSLPSYFQQAITGMSFLIAEHEQSISRTSERSQEGMIPITTPSSTQFLLPESSTIPEPSLLSQNLLSILQRPSFIASPLPRWTAPPQWLQFQTLRTYEEGLMTNEDQNSNINTYTTYTEDIRTQIQTNFQGLLQSRPEDAFTSAPAQRWQQPEQWLQASLGEEIGPRPPVRFDNQFDDGLISAPPRVNDPSSTPSVTCSFGLMQQIGFGERKLEFYPETFSAVDAPFFANRVRSQASNTTDLMFLVITDWQPWFRKSLQDAFPDFPIQTLSQFSAPQVSSMLPSIDYNEGELTCIMEHINTHNKPRERFANEREIDVGTAKAQCLPLVVWTRAQGGIEAQPDRPLIVVISKRTDKISSKIINHYSNDRYKRWDRLTKNQAWVYLDLYFLFTKWDRIWAAVKRHQQKRTEEVHARQNVLPILQQTRQLHKDNNIMISLREHVRIHKASLKIVMQRVEYMLGGVDFMATQGLKGRLDDAYQLLEYYEVTATTLLEQQQNLLSLAFNLETVAQGAAVARLNALAFVFLPLSFVASVFGITTFTAPPKWYPVAAVPVLLATVFIAYVANQFFTSRALKDSGTAEAEEPLVVNNDLENIPTVNTVVSVSTWKTFRARVTRRTAKISKVDTNNRGLWATEPTGINDPSRLTRRSTDRSLAARSYAPPRSTVQFIPGAYDLSSVGPSYYSSYSSPPSHIPSSQSYDFATGTSGTLGYDGPVSQVSQFSGPYSPVYRPFPSFTSVAEADGTPLYRPEPNELGSSITGLRPSTPVAPPLPISARETEVTDDLYDADVGVLEVKKARALYNFDAVESEDLSFKEGEIITLSRRTDPYKDWAHGRIGSRFGVFPRSFVEIIDAPGAGGPASSTNYIAYSPSNLYSIGLASNSPAPSDTDIPYSQHYGEPFTPYVPDSSVPSTSYVAYPPDGDETGYRPEAPDSFGLPPEGFSSSFAGQTLEESASDSSIPTSRRSEAVLGSLNDVMIGIEESSANVRLEPIPEEGSVSDAG